MIPLISINDPLWFLDICVHTLRTQIPFNHRPLHRSLHIDGRVKGRKLFSRASKLWSSIWSARICSKVCEAHPVTWFSVKDFKSSLRFSARASGGRNPNPGIRTSDSMRFGFWRTADTIGYNLFIYLILQHYIYYLSPPIVTQLQFCEETLHKTPWQSFSDSLLHYQVHACQFCWCLWSVVKEIWLPFHSK